MKDNSNSNNKKVVALGIFDGVHRGHSEVLRVAAEVAARLGAQPAVFTFSTKTVTTKGAMRPLLTDEDKLFRLQRQGFAQVSCYDFSALCGMSAEDFVKEILCGELNACGAVCGDDFHFGKGGSANAAELVRLGKRYGIEVHIARRICVDGDPISSTRIRALLKNGGIAQANRLLGYHYGYDLPVVHGFERGREWGFPTANQQIPSYLELPRFGVYCSQMYVDGVWLPGVTNIGVKPTVEDEQTPLAETFIIDYSGDLYGRRLRLKLYEFVRPERRFESLEALKAEIARNTEFARKYFGI